MSTVQEQIERTDAAIAERERLVRAPRELADLTSQRMQLERRAEREAEIAEARRVDPEWDRKLADARVAVEAAGAEVDKHERARYERLRSPKRSFNENRDGGKVLADATPEAFEGTIAAGGSLPIGGGEGLSQSLGMRFLPAKTLAHQIAQGQYDEARAYLKRLERWPHLYALDKLQAATSGETTEERIANAPRVTFGRVRGFVSRRAAADDGAA